MSLDFVVLGQNGAPEMTVSLGVNLHHEMTAAALALGLTSFHNFSDYYQDVDMDSGEIPLLASHAQELFAKTSSIELQCFLGDLSALIAYAMDTGKALHAIAD